MFKCIIIDDEPHAIEGLQEYLREIPQLELVKSYTDPLLALKEISIGPPVDFIFLDVDMPRINGIELSREIRGQAKKLIFTTAHSKYAYDAFEVSADAFLLKPYSLGKFMIVIHKILAEYPPVQIIKPTQQAGAQDFFFVKSKEDDLRILKVKFDNVLAVESRQNYVMIYTTEKNILTYMGLSEIGKILAIKPNFMQLHRCFVVNLTHIESIDGNLVKMSNGIRISVGDNYRKEFNSFVNEKLIKAGKQL